MEKLKTYRVTLESGKRFKLKAYDRADVLWRCEFGKNIPSSKVKKVEVVRGWFFK